MTVLVALTLGLLAMKLLPALAFAAAPRAATITCHAETAAGVVTIPLASQDADHLYFSGHDGTATYDATYHIKEQFVYLLITTGPASQPIKLSGNFLLNGVGLSATLTFNQGAQLSQLICAE